MTECQGCGAWNDSSRTVCVLCGTPLAETDEWDAAAELPPLPPLPDGGLSASMPAWLREPLAREAEPGSIAAHAPETAPATVEAPTAPPPAQTDPRLFLTDDDFPRWLRALAAARAAARAADAPAAVPLPPPPAPWTGWSGSPAASPRVESPSPAAAAPASEPPAAALVGARAREERRPRAPWETMLLVILFIGMVVAALWALASNGVFSPGM